MRYQTISQSWEEFRQKTLADLSPTHVDDLMRAFYMGYATAMHNMLLLIDEQDNAAVVAALDALAKEFDAFCERFAGRSNVH